MRIGFDAKRFFFNTSGLGNYSRNLVSALTKYKPEHNLFLFSPSSKYTVKSTIASNTSVVYPSRYLDRNFSSYWRSHSILKDIIKNDISIYHGLSHELPFGIGKTNIKSVVTIHDLIFLRRPELFSFIDRQIYEKKFKYSCNVADKIIAISHQTKDDIIELFNIDAGKIEVIYQGCDEIFLRQYTDEEIDDVKRKYSLPTEFILSVGTIEERKNTLLTIKALHKANIKIPFYIVGRKTAYYNVLMEYILKNNLSDQVKFLHGVPTEDLPLIYQQARAFIYPSIYEGFGIPVLEALNSSIPVITGNSKCLKEVGGSNSLFVNTSSIEDMENALNTVLYKEDIRQTMISEGVKHADKFTASKMVSNLISIYRSL